jgi:hypothetical protein
VQTGVAQQPQVALLHRRGVYIATHCQSSMFFSSKLHVTCTHAVLLP